MANLGTRLIEAIEPTFKAHGFKRNKHGVFIRPTSYGFDNFLWASHPTVTDNHSMAQKYSLLMGVRHDRVENEVNKLGLIYGHDNQKRTTTVSTPLELFPPTQERKYFIVIEHNAPDEVITKAAASLISILQADALPFYSAYSSIERCSAGLNTAFDQRSHFLHNNFESRVYHAITAAHVAGIPNFEDIVKTWQTNIESTLPPSLWQSTKDRVEKLILDLTISPIDGP